VRSGDVRYERELVLPMALPTGKLLTEKAETRSSRSGNHFTHPFKQETTTQTNDAKMY